MACEYECNTAGSNEFDSRRTKLTLRCVEFWTTCLERFKAFDRARRTASKYAEALNIDISSWQIKHFHNALGGSGFPRLLPASLAFFTRW